jgi:hypothetical protein
MEMRFNIPFQELLMLVRALTPNQRERLRKELDEISPLQEENDEFIDFLLKGPVYSKEEIKIIEENRKSINKWRIIS